jgi:hypothetical protein
MKSLIFYCCMTVLLLLGNIAIVNVQVAGTGVFIETE